MKKVLLIILFFIAILIVVASIPPGFRLAAKDVIPAFVVTIMSGFIGLVLYLLLNRKSRLGKWTVSDEERPNINRAYSLTWIIFYFVIVAFTVGRGWDASYHTTNPFEDFYSAPHLFIYSQIGLALLLTFFLVRNRASQKWFGEYLSFPPIPGSLFILIGGVLSIQLAGFFDNMWHTKYGLDETNFSFPHSMLGWGVLVTVMGMVSCVLALKKYREPSTILMIIFGILVINSSIVPIMGSYYSNPLPIFPQIISRIPVLMESEAAQRAFSLYTTWNINRTNPLFIILASFWLGAVMSFLQKLIPRRKIFLIVTLLATLLFAWSEKRMAIRLGLGNFPSAWLPLPLFLWAFVLSAGQKMKISSNVLYGIVGLLNGIYINLIWVHKPSAGFLIILGVVAILLGKKIGEISFRAVEEPTLRRAWIFLITATLILPFLWGIIDLQFRKVLP